MRNNSLILTGHKSLIFAVLLIAACLINTAHCQPVGDTALLLQQSPLQGGSITPATGIHKFSLSSEVTITAVPRPGYQFVYWMGDVSDPTVSSTTVHLDSPKIVIAVFERIASEFRVTVEGATSAPYQRLFPSAGDIRRLGGGGGGAVSRKPFKWPQLPEPPESDDFPVPGDGEDFPVPIPEPTTIMLFGLAALLLRKKPKQRFTNGHLKRNKN